MLDKIISFFRFLLLFFFFFLSFIYLNIDFLYILNESIGQEKEKSFKWINEKTTLCTKNLPFDTNWLKTCHLIRTEMRYRKQLNYKKFAVYENWFLMDKRCPCFYRLTQWHTTYCQILGRINLNLKDDFEFIPIFWLTFF